jgi:hypothetical protein
MIKPLTVLSEQCCIWSQIGDAIIYNISNSKVVRPKVHIYPIGKGLIINYQRNIE